MRKSESAGKIHLASYEDLFTPTESRNTVPPSDNIQQINIEKLYTFKNHPYPVLDDEEMQQLEDSIRENGIITPLLVRPQASGSYEIISGHRRCYAARKAGLSSIPVIVRELSDDESIMLMVDANAQREHIPLSVKAKAYKMKLDAMKRQVGRPKKQNGGQVVHHCSQRENDEQSSCRSRDILAEDTGESGRQIQRYIRLSYLIPPLLEMVDAGQIKLIPAVSLSYLSPTQQEQLINYMHWQHIKTVSLEQAKLLRTGQDVLSDDDLQTVFSPIKPSAKDITLKIPTSLFPAHITTKQEVDKELLQRIAETIQQYYEGK